MNKKFLSLVLALVMVLGTFTTVFAEEAKTEKVEKVVGKDNKIQYVIDKKFVEGYGDGDYGYDKNIKRSEITKLLVFANGDKELAEKLQGTPNGLYKDVDEKYWANGVIMVGSTTPSKANKQPMLNGYPDGTFKGENDVTYAELAKMLVVLVKEDLTADMIKEANKQWPAQWMTWANQLGILDDVTVANANAPANRADAFTMLYNALYKMVEFRRTPVNDKVGVLSSLRNDKLVLNQDADKQTYTITKDTVFVGTLENGVNSNTVKVKSINDPDYYLGSLVRIMVNDKNEVSHILELGNPKDLALGAGAVGSVANSRWAGVAKRTVETPYTKVNTLDSKKELRPVMAGWAKINFNGNKTKVNGITFEYADTSIKDVTLSVNDKTKVYVANPYNNQMREVKDINEAMSLLGYNEGVWNMIPNVYAGFDTDGYEASLHGYENNVAPAKVIVFNVVTKAKGGETLRVVMTEGYNGSATLEDTDGVKKDRSFIKNIANFPYNSADGLYNVVELKWAAYNNNFDLVEKKIVHKDTTKYPVVKVIEPQDNNNLTVIDRFGEETTIYVGDADIFTKPEYKNMKDKYIQFRNVNGNEELAKLSADKQAESHKIEILSILPNDRNVVEKFENSSSIKWIVKSVQKNTANGIVKEVSKLGDKYIAKIDVQFSNWKKDVYRGLQTFVVSDNDASLLKANYGKSVKFIIDEKDRYREFPLAFNFESNEATALNPATNLDASRLNAYLAAVDAYRAEKAKGISETNAAELEKLIDDVTAKKKALSTNDIANMPGNYDNTVANGLDEATEKAALVAPKAQAQARKELKDEIAKAKALVNSTVASNDGSGIKVGQFWATQTNINTLNTAITAAETVANDMTKSTADLGTAKTAITGAMTSFTRTEGAATN